MKRRHTRLGLAACLALAWAGGTASGREAGRPPASLPAASLPLTLPQAKDSLRFLVIGDSGTGGKSQYQLAALMLAYHDLVPYELALMLGDNIYGRERPADYRDKFETPYRRLLDAGVKFHASLGNHDDPNQRFYQGFNMGGKRYYSFSGPRASVRFFALDSNYMDPAQIAWLRKELESAKEDWKIAFFHHPLYSSGKRHGPDDALRELLEPILLEHGVALVLAGHEHFYERLKPQKGIHYFISGGAAKLRQGGILRTELTAKGWAASCSFLLFELAGDDLHFQAIEENGKTIDSGVLRRPGAAPALEPASAPTLPAGARPSP